MGKSSFLRSSVARTERGTAVTPPWHYSAMQSLQSSDCLARTLLSNGAVLWPAILRSCVTCFRQAHGLCMGLCLERVHLIDLPCQDAAHAMDHSEDL